MIFSTKRIEHQREAERAASFTGATPRCITKAQQFRDDWWEAAQAEGERVTRDHGCQYSVDLNMYYDTSRTYLHGA